MTSHIFCLARSGWLIHFDTSYDLEKHHTTAVRERSNSESNFTEMNRLLSCRPVSSGEPVEGGGTKNHGRGLETVGGGQETDSLFAADNEVVKAE